MRPVHTLTSEQQALATTIAERRFSQHEAAGSPHACGRPRDGHAYDLTAEIASIGAEIAAGEILGLEWTDKPLAEDRDGDLPGNVQVRYTHHEHGRLIVYDKDNPDHTFVLVTGTYPTFTVRGWIRGSEALAVGTYSSLRPDTLPCTNVAQRQLKPLATFPMKQVTA